MQSFIPLPSYADPRLNIDHGKRNEYLRTYNFAPGETKRFKIIIPKYRGSRQYSWGALNKVSASYLVMDESHRVMPWKDNASSSVSDMSFMNSASLAPGTYFIDLSNNANSYHNFDMRFAFDDYSDELVIGSTKKIALTKGKGSVRGSINNDTDIDWFKFKLAKSGSLEIVNDGVAIKKTIYLVDADDKVHLGESIDSSMELGADVGTYLIKVESAGDHGDYKLALKYSKLNSKEAVSLDGVFMAMSEPEIEVVYPFNSNQNIPDGGTLVIDGVSVNLHSFLIKVKNTGTSTLTLGSIQGLPNDGFSLRRSFYLTAPGSPLVNSLAPGQEANVLFNYAPHHDTRAQSVANISFTTNDSNENPFNITLIGRPKAVPFISVSQGGSPVPKGDVLDFGEVAELSKVYTFTVSNPNGETDLILDKVQSRVFTTTWVWVDGINKDGFTLESDFANTVVPPNGSTTFSVRFTPDFQDPLVKDVRIGFPINSYIEGNLYYVDLKAKSAPQPNIEVYKDGNLMTNEDEFDFGTTGVVKTETFVIENSGNVNLNLGAISGLPGNGFSLTTPYNNVVPPGQSTSFALSYTPDHVTGTNGQSRVIGILSNDAVDSPFNISLKGKAVPKPELVLKQDTTVIGDGAEFDLGTVDQDTVLTTFTVENIGTDDLVLDSSILGLPVNGFSLDTGFAATTLAPGATTTFRTLFTTNFLDNSEKQAVISFDNNDEDEDPNSFTIKAKAEDRPEIEVIENGDILGNGAVLNFGTINTDTADRTFTVRNIGTDDLTLQAIQGLSGQFSLLQNFGSNSLAPGASTTFQVRFTTDFLDDSEKSVDISFGNNDRDEEDPFNLTLKASAAPRPELELVQGATLIANTGDYNLGTINQNTISTIFRVNNIGTDDLTLGNIQGLEGAGVNGFTLVQDMGSNTLTRGQSTTFEVLFTPNFLNASEQAATISFTNNDLEENPNSFTLRATPELRSEIQVFQGTDELDDGDEYDYQVISTATVDRTFTVKNIGPKDLTLGNILNLDGLRFSLLSGFGKTTLATDETTTFTVRFTPDFEDDSVKTRTLSFATNDVSGGEDPFDLTVKAQAEPRPELELKQGDVLIDLVNNEFDLGTVDQDTVSTVFTVKNRGTDDLTLGDIQGLGAVGVNGFTLASPLGSTTLTRGQSTTFEILFTTDFLNDNGRVATISFGNNDLDENPMSFDIKATAELRPEIQVWQGSTELEDNDEYDYETISTTTADTTFTVVNIGTRDLTLGSILGLTGNEYFSLVSGFGSTTLAPDASTTFTVRFEPDFLDDSEKSVNISFSNNDRDEENPFNLTLKAKAAPRPELDLRQAGVLIDADNNVHDVGTVSTDTVTTVFTVNNIGTDDLSLSNLLVSPTDYFTISQGFGSSTLARGESTTFEVLFTADFLNSDEQTATVSFNNNDLSENPNSFTIKARPELRSEIVVRHNTANINDGDPHTYGVVNGNTLRTFTVENLGTKELSLEDIVGLGANGLNGFTLASDFGSRTLQPLESTTFTILFTPDFLDDSLMKAPISFANNDVTENPFNIVLDARAEARPEMELSQGSTDLADGATYPFGEVNGDVFKVFTIENIGTDNLLLGDITGLPVNGFSLHVDMSDKNLASQETTAFMVKFKPDFLDDSLQQAEITIPNNDHEEDPYHLTLTAQAEPRPEVEVREDGVEILDGNDYNFGEVNGNVLKTFTVKNIGTDNLTLVDVAGLAVNGFSLVQGLGNTDLAPQESTTFMVLFEPNFLEGEVKSAAISFANNDLEENPFNITLKAQAEHRPEITVDQAGTNIEVDDEYDFGEVAGNTVATFTVTNDGPADLSLNDIQGLNDFFKLDADFGDRTLSNGETTTFSIRFEPNFLEGEDKVTTISFGNNDLHENPFRIKLRAQAEHRPEIRIDDQLGNNIDDDDEYYFGVVNGDTTATFTVINDGPANLTLNDIQGLDDFFKLDADFGDRTLSNGETTTFSIRFEPNFLEGEDKVTTISFGNNDLHENPFRIRLRAQAEHRPEIRINDPSGNNIDVDGEYNFGEVNGDTAATFTVINDGPVDLTLNDIQGLDDFFKLDADFGDRTLSNGETTTFRVLFKPNFLEGEPKTTTISFGNNDLHEDPFRIRLRAQAEHRPEITVDQAGTNIKVNDEYDFGEVAANTVASFTVTNDGPADLTLNDIQGLNDYFKLDADFGVRTLGNGDTTTFRIRFEPDFLEGEDKTTTISFGNNDLHENPFTIRLRAQAEHRPEITVDQAGTNIEVDDEYNFGEVAGNTVATFTVTNDGPANLSLNDIQGLNDFFKLDADFGDRTLSNGETTTFSIRFEPDFLEGEGKVTTISFGNNDLHENPFRIKLRAQAEHRPEIRIDDPSGNNIDVDDEYNFGEVNGDTIATFTVINDGPANLTLNDIQGLANGFSLDADFADRTLSNGETTTFDILFKPDFEDGSIKTTTISFANNDLHENPFSIVLKAQAEPRPEIAVSDQIGTNIDVGGAYSYGVVDTDDITATFTVENRGPADLTLSDIQGLNKYFTLASDFGDRTLSNGETTTFAIKFVPEFLEGDVKSTTISFANNDHEENPFSIVLSAQAEHRPEVELRQNGVEIEINGEYDYGSVEEDSLIKTFTVHNIGTANLSLNNIEGLPDNGFSLESGLATSTLIPGASTSFSVKFEPDFLNPNQEFVDISFGNNDREEDPFTLTLKARAFLRPEMELKDGTADIADGATINLGVVNGDVSKTFTIENIGIGDLELGAITGLPTQGFSLSQDLGETTVAPGGGSTTFTVLFTPDFLIADQRSASITIPNNDRGEDPYNITLLAQAEPRPELEIKLGDDILNNGSELDYGTLDANATKTFTVTNIGTDDLNLGAITGLPNDRFSLVEDMDKLTLAPGESTSFKVLFEPDLVIGRSIQSSATISISNNDLDEDPFELTLRGAGVPLYSEIELSQGSNNIASGSTYDYGTLVDDATTTFVIKNTGTGNLELGAITGLPNEGFSIVEDLGSSSLAPGETTSFKLSFSPNFVLNNSIVSNASLSIATNDDDEDPFTLDLRGAGIPLTSVIRLRVDGAIITDPSLIDLGTLSGSVVKNFTVQNMGTAELTLGDMIGLNTAFSLASDFSERVLARGDISAFKIKFTPKLVESASVTSTANVSFTKFDGDTEPYEMGLKGAGAPLPKEQESSPSPPPPKEEASSSGGGGVAEIDGIPGEEEEEEEEQLPTFILGTAENEILTIIPPIEPPEIVTNGEEAIVEGLEGESGNGAGLSVDANGEEAVVVPIEPRIFVHKLKKKKTTKIMLPILKTAESLEKTLKLKIGVTEQEFYDLLLFRGDGLVKISKNSNQLQVGALFHKGKKFRKLYKEMLKEQGKLTIDIPITIKDIDTDYSIDEIIRVQVMNPPKKKKKKKKKGKRR